MATTNLSDYKPLNISNADEYSIGIVVSEWNDFITYNLRNGALETLKAEGIKEENIHVYYVPGAFELSFATMKLCKSNKFAAVIAIGNVIGSNIFNVFWILGVTALISPLAFSVKSNIDILVGIGATVLLFIFMFVGKRHVLKRWQGVVFVLIYIAYLWFLLATN